MKRVKSCLQASLLSIALVLSVVGLVVPTAQAVTNPQTNSTGLSGSIGSAPPKTAPTITTPNSGQTFTNLPITVAGLCTSGLLVKIFDNNVFMGSVVCSGGSYTIKIDLFSDRNDLVARQYDALDQASPDSNIVTITFKDQQFNSSGSGLMYLTSDYARRGANPGDELTWPIILNGGTGPYAISIDWGDGKADDLMSMEFPGNFTIKHTYDNAGSYTVIIKATDKNGLNAYLQLVAVANGAVTSSSTSSDNKQSVVTVTKIVWMPAAILVPLIAIGFWLGRKSQIATLRKHLDKIEY